MYCNFFIRRKIINVYSNDGPGILEEELKSKNLKRIHVKRSCASIPFLDDFITLSLLG